MRLELREVGHRFGPGPDLFSGEDLSLGPGDMIAVMAPSGAGKSTLLTIASGLLIPSHGKVVVCEADGSEREPTEHDIAWIHQVSAVLPGRSALDNAAIPLLAIGHQLEEARALARVGMERLGLGHVADSLVGALSGGEVQRVSVLRALLSPGQFIIADEPTAQLDTANAHKVLGALRYAAQQGKGVLLATHDVRMAQACDHIVNLSQPEGGRAT